MAGGCARIGGIYLPVAGRAVRGADEAREAAPPVSRRTVWSSGSSASNRWGAWSSISSHTSSWVAAGAKRPTGREDVGDDRAAGGGDGLAGQDDEQGAGRGGLRPPAEPGRHLQPGTLGVQPAHGARAERGHRDRAGLIPTGAQAIPDAVKDQLARG